MGPYLLVTKFPPTASKVRLRWLTANNDLEAIQAARSFAFSIFECYETNQENVEFRLYLNDVLVPMITVSWVQEWKTEEILVQFSTEFSE